MYGLGFAGGLVLTMYCDFYLWMGDGHLCMYLGVWSLPVMCHPLAFVGEVAIWFLRVWCLWLFPTVSRWLLLYCTARIVWCLSVFPCNTLFAWVQLADVCCYMVQLWSTILCMLEFCSSLFIGHSTIHMLLSSICRLAAAMLYSPMLYRFRFYSTMPFRFELFNCILFCNHTAWALGPVYLA